MNRRKRKIARVQKAIEELITRVDEHNDWQHKQILGMRRHVHMEIPDSFVSRKSIFAYLDKYRNRGLPKPIRNFDSFTEVQIFETLCKLENEISWSCPSSFELEQVWNLITVQRIMKS